MEVARSPDLPSHSSPHLANEKGTALSFLMEGGEMGSRMRAHAWEPTPLGRPATWPVSLGTLVGVMLGSRQPMFLTWGPDRIMLYNDAYAPLLGTRHPDALGRSFTDVWHDIQDVVGPILDRAYAGEGTHMDDLELLMHRNGYPEKTHFAFSYTPVRGDGSTVLGMFCACTETTGEVMARRRRDGERERFINMFAQAPSFMAMLRGPRHVVELTNAAYERLTGRSVVVGLAIREALPDIEGQGFFELLDTVYASGEPFVGEGIKVTFQQTADTAPQERYVSFVYQPVKDEHGQVEGIFVDGQDITDRKGFEDRQALMVRELHHRVKNTLATVQSIIGLTLRTSPDMEGFRTSIGNRIASLARSHAALTDAEWKGMPLKAMLRSELEPYDDGRRLIVEGPKVFLPGETVVPLTMAIHELATNAVKHGALSTPEGQIEVRWHVARDEAGKALHLDWSETGGPTVTPPTRRGFGTTLLERLLGGQLEGSATIAYPPEGVRVQIHAKLSDEGAGAPPDPSGSARGAAKGEGVSP